FDQFIALLNRERCNDCVYVGLFVLASTMLWDDKELLNVPLSQINVVDGRPAPGSVQVLRESLASEAFIPLGGFVSGVISLNLQPCTSFSRLTLKLSFLFLLPFFFCAEATLPSFFPFSFGWVFFFFFFFSFLLSLFPRPTPAVGASPLTKNS